MFGHLSKFFEVGGAGNISTLSRIFFLKYFWSIRLLCLSTMCINQKVMLGIFLNHVYLLYETEIIKSKN